MFTQKRYAVLSLLVVFVMALSVLAVPRNVSRAQEFQPMSYAAPACYADGYSGEFLSIEAVDELTVKFKLCRPDPAFPSKVAFSAFSINSSDYLEATGGGGDLVDKPIGTGPYVLEEWKRGDSLVLKRNENYWGTPALMDRVVFRWNSEGAARLTELQAGTVDGIDNPSPDDYEKIRTDPNLVLYDRPGMNIFYIGFNNTFEPLNDVRVRRALAMGMDMAEPEHLAEPAFAERIWRESGGVTGNFKRILHWSAKVAKRHDRVLVAHDDISEALQLFTPYSPD